jgi:hypothetical protein
MTCGALIFAQNNAEIDYANLAVFAAKRVKHFLNIPVTLVTDSGGWLLESHPDAKDIFDNIIDIWSPTDQVKKFNDGSLFGKNLKWNNFSRTDVFDYTPYDETLVLDSDYIISSNNLSKIWNNKQDFLIYRSSYDLAQWRDKKSFEYFNQYAIPFYWATAFYFKKTAINQSFFTLVKHIKNNWNYYRSLYLLESPTFRNDFAFSIALHIMHDSIDNSFVGHLPGKMYYTLDKDFLLEIKENKLKFLLEKEKFHGEYTLAKTENLDVHIMNKFSLSRIINGEVNV